MSAVIVLAVLLASAVLVPPLRPGRADPGLSATMGYSLEPGAYNNSVRIANLSDVNHPKIAADRSATSPFNGTVYAIGLQYTNGFVCEPLVVVRSLDGGKSFEAPRPTDLCLDGGAVDAVVALNGTVYVVAPGPVVYRSIDRGLGWQELARIANQTGVPSLAMDPVTGFLYVSWYWDGDSTMFSPQFSASRDGGLTWSTPSPVLPGGHNGTSAQVAAYNHTAVVSLVDEGISNSTVVATAFTDDGANRSAPLRLSSPTYCTLYAGPAVAVSPGGVFAVSWYVDPAYLGTGCWDTLGNTTETFVALSTDGGRTFSAPRLAGGPPGWPTWNFGHTIAFDDASRLYVAWWAPDTQMTNYIFVASSTDLGDSFNESSFYPTFTVSGGNASGPDSLAPGPEDQVFLAWSVYYTQPANTTAGPGVYVRAVAGGAEGDVVNGTSLSSLEIGLRDESNGTELVRTPWTGTPVSVNGLHPGAYAVWIYSGNDSLPLGSMPVRAWDLTSFTIQIGGGGPGGGGTPGGNPPPGSGPPWILIVFLSGGALAVSVVLASLLHTRLVGENVLQRKVRVLLYEYVRDHPGTSFTEVRNAAGLQNGVAAYHLGVLERQGFLHSERRRGHRWYFPNGDVSAWRNLPLSPFQRSLVEEVRQNPGIGVRELARRVGRRASSVGYNVRALSRDGVLRTQRMGTRLQCFAGDESA